MPSLYNSAVLVLHIQEIWSDPPLANSAGCVAPSPMQSLPGWLTNTFLKTLVAEHFKRRSKQWSLAAPSQVSSACLYYALPNCARPKGLDSTPLQRAARHQPGCFTHSSLTPASTLCCRPHSNCRNCARSHRLADSAERHRPQVVVESCPMTASKNATPACPSTVGARNFTTRLLIPAETHGGSLAPAAPRSGGLRAVTAPEQISESRRGGAGPLLRLRGSPRAAQGL